MDSKTTVALCVLDALGVGPETCDEIKGLAAEKCGIEPRNILIAATHAHSVPGTGASATSPAQLDYRKRFVEGAAEAIAKAHAALQPASVGWAVHPLAEEVRNRRWYLHEGKMKPNPWGAMDRVAMNPGQGSEVLDRPAGPIDPDLMILSVMDERGRKPRALFANYALHYVGGLPDDKVSSDYFGEFARLMPSRVKGDAGYVAMMSNGASGDINNIPFLLDRPPRETGEQARIVARKAADAAWRAWKKIEAHEAVVPIGMIERPTCRAPYWISSEPSASVRRATVG